MGVAGLSALRTAKAMGATVVAYDPRRHASLKHMVEIHGGKYIPPPPPSFDPLRMQEESYLEVEVSQKKILLSH